MKQKTVQNASYYSEYLRNEKATTREPRSNLECFRLRLASSETLPQQRVPLPAVSMWAAQTS